MTQAATTTASETPIRTGSSGRYLEQSERPLHSLLFVLPLIIAYEVWIHFQPQQRIVAFSLVQKVFGLLRASSIYLTPLAIVFILLFWHIARGDSWKVRLGTLVSMAVESFCWGAALLTICALVTRTLPPANPTLDLPAMLLASVGAGLYEELVFRLIAMTFLSMILIDWICLPHRLASVLIVVLPAIGFGLYHYLGAERQTVHILLFRCLAGGYLGLLFMVRGFGITVGGHISYDAIFFILQWWPRH